MTTNTNKENNNRIPGKESLRQGGWEGTRKTHAKLPRTTLCLKTLYASKTQKTSTTFAQCKHMHWRIQTVIWNTSGQKGALRHRTALKMLGSTPPH